jgi:hypothetical protein
MAALTILPTESSISSLYEFAFTKSSNFTENYDLYYSSSIDSDLPFPEIYINLSPPCGKTHDKYV